MSLPAHALPDVWRARELARSHEAGLDTGHAALNAVLPGGGWPRSGLTELLQPRPGCGEWGLLAPALARLGVGPTQGRAHRAGPVKGAQCVLVGAPHAALGPALRARQLDPARFLQVAASTPEQRLWVAEQALRCADVACVLVWLAQAQAPQLRRLHLTAQEHGKLLFVLRPERAQQESSPAPLRLLLGWQGESTQPVPPLWVRVLKRRGPPLEAPLALTTASPGLQALLSASRAQARLRRSLAVQPTMAFLERVHAVDRAASLV